MESSPPGQHWLRTAALFGLGYVVVGLVTVALSRSAPDLRTVARPAAWGISALIFGAHIRLEHRWQQSPSRAAGHTATAVALATLTLAAVAVIRELLASHPRPSVLLAIAVWPILTGLVSFVVALTVLAVLARRRQPPMRP